MSRPEPKPWIAQIHAYVPGKSKSASGRPLVKLSANENPLGSSPAALAALAEGHVAADYPDPDARALREAIAEVHGLDPDRIVCGTGSDELIGLICHVYGGPGADILMSAHGFTMYDIAGTFSGARVIKVPERNVTTDVSAMLEAVTPETRIVFVAHPNNPTGTLLPQSEVERLRALVEER